MRNSFFLDWFSCFWAQAAPGPTNPRLTNPQINSQQDVPFFIGVTSKFIT
jgi:hypothetical protein